MTSNLYSSSENNHNLTSSSVSMPTQSVEADADRLMDDLFADLDRILDGGSRLPSEPIHPEYIALKSVVVPPIIMPPPSHESALIAQNEQNRFSESSQINSQSNQKPPTNNLNFYQLNQKESRNFIDKILFIIACLSLIGVVGWLIYQKKIPLPFLTKINPQTVTNNITISPEDQQFISYMLRSLELIENKNINPPKPTATALPNLPANVKIPPIANPNNNQPQTVIERIYIPYPTAQNTPSTNSNLNQNNNNKNTTTPTPIPSKAPTPLAIPTPQTTPNLDFNVPPPPLPGVTHTLVGLLEAGDNSAALFDINGSTQRIKVGEAIGTSGWALVSVASQQAIIRRNGEVRSIYVGQKF